MPLSFTRSQLKWIAAFAMTADHLAYFLCRNNILHTEDAAYNVQRMTGRIAFPIFLFFIVEGYFHTRDKFSYMYRLSLLAALSQIPFSLCMMGEASLSYWNTIAELFLAFVVICFASWWKSYLPAVCLAVFAGAVFAEFFQLDYGAEGIFLSVLFYIFYQFPYRAAVYAAAILYFLPAFGGTAVLSVPLILCYNGKRGKRQRWFYLYYPLHFLIISLIAG